jgi:drug/metabolite transporter (DMT)-like permease
MRDFSAAMGLLVLVVSPERELNVCHGTIADPGRRQDAAMTHAGTGTLSGGAFATLLLIAFMMGANHVAARVAFDHGVDVATAVSVRSTVTALVVAALIALQRVPLTLTRRHRRALAAIGLLVGVQSLCLYSAVARLPVALALLAFNTYPLWTALWARLLYANRPERRVVLAMPVMLIGLALALDVLGAASGLGATAQWRQIGAGVAFALAAAATFGYALVLTQHEAGDLDGRLRTATTMAIVAVIAIAAATAQGGFHLPDAAPGWWGLAALTFLYGTAFTIMFTVLPRLGVVGNSAIMNVEPVFALGLAWLVLGQSIAPSQVGGGVVVVATVIWLGLRRPRLQEALPE